MGFLTFIIIVGILAFILEKLLMKWFKVERKRVSETPGKDIERWGIRILLCAFLCISIFFHKYIDHIELFTSCYFMIIMGFQAFLEWKYVKTKQYVITLIFLMLFAVIAGSMYYIF